MQEAQKMHTKGQAIRRRNRRRGLTLIEAAMALGLFALAAGYAVQQVAVYLDNVKSRSVADKMVEVSEAAKGYVKANYAALLNATPVNAVTVIPAGRPTATSSVPSGPSGLASLQGGGFLASSFVDINGYGQRHALLVRRVSTSRLEALVTTYGGRQIRDGSLSTIGNYVGNTGGFVPEKPPVAADANKILGAYGGYRYNLSFWGTSAERPTAGRFQSSLAFEDGKLLADYLYRNDIGVEEANRMNTAIDMNRNNLDNAETVNAQNVRSSIDVWAGRDVTADNNVIAGVDVNAGRDVNAVRDIHANRNIISEQDVVSYRDLDVYRNGRVGGNLNVNQNLAVAMDASVTGNLKVDGQADIATLDLNRTKVLVPGRYGAAQDMKLSDLLPRQVAQYSYVVKPGDAAVPKPDCAGGYSKARIFVYRQVDSIKGYPQVRLVTTSQNGYLTSVAQDIPESFVNVADGLVATTSPASSIWNVAWIGSQPADGATRQAIAQTYCYYG
ncbi:shufflon system plasmid conjugative transfer pilus tip adhesin PilV [Agrobacterium rubi]|nr:shufflon system plasmid conjugative transfer pilus tip adhesin PilV [Agrobacterium rubi]NTF24222.1 shufflon system plasmid conjugative transfer pilus tip adhesin PilV [Agrobacterium rubi]